MKGALKQFIQQHNQTGKPFLLALSGGPDSLALFYHLLELRQEMQLLFAVAHVDHSWRAESAKEAAALQALSESNKVTFYLKTLSPVMMQGNLEAACRIERQRFFKELCDAHGYQAVMLAHHANDQAETVLKKLLEAVPFSGLHGMRAVHVINDLTLWRPWLSVPKQKLQVWLKEKGKVAFEDATNADSRFLRARFRTDLMPYLNECFGKNVDGSLQQIHKQAMELEEFLDQRYKSFSASSVHTCKLGVWADFTAGFSAFESKELIRRLCLQNGIHLSAPIIEQTHQLLFECKANKQVRMGDHTLYVDRGHLFLIEATHRETQWGAWQFSIGAEASIPVRGWKDLWKEKVTIQLPAGEYQLMVGTPQMRIKDGPSLERLWNNHKVPAFLRQLVPVIVHQDFVYYDLLTATMFQN